MSDRQNSPLVAVVSFTGNSGLTDYAVSFCREAAKHCDVVLMTADSIDPFYRGMGFPVDTVFRRSRHYPVDVVRFARRMVLLRPRLVVFQGPLKFALMDAAVVRYLRARGIQVAVVVHDVVPHSERWMSTLALRLYYRAFPRLVAHSSAALERLHQAGIRRPTLVVPHGRYDIFDVDGVSRDEARAHLGIDQDRTVALFFGNLEERKGLAEFVAAAEEDKGRTTLFLAAGKDHLTPSAPRRLRELLRGEGGVPGLRLDVGRVPHSDVQHYFKAADVVVLPYREGTTSGVLKLAFAFDIPALATDVGDVGEQLVDGRGNILADTSPEAIIAGIHTLAGRAEASSNDESVEWRTITPTVLAFLDPSQWSSDG